MATAAPVKPKSEPKIQGIKSVYGRMVDPTTALEYNMEPSELYKRTAWVDSQIEAGKLQLCDL